MIRRRLHLNHPRDLNEKIQWLKFHADMNDWARLADKYAVRDYVKEKGLDKILPRLYGRYECGEDLLNDWDKLPMSFVIKTNNGCGTNMIVKDKTLCATTGLAKTLNGWLGVQYGNIPIEFHYNLIKPCLVVEELLVDDTQEKISGSLIDYKIWCFNGKPFSILVVFDRDMNHPHHYTLDCYDLEWNKQLGAMTDHKPKRILPKPDNLDLMLKYAGILSEDHPQMRVDMYNIGGKIYFGELTMSSMGGFMNYYTPEYLLEMGNQITLS